MDLLARSPGDACLSEADQFASVAAPILIGITLHAQTGEVTIGVGERAVAIRIEVAQCRSQS